MLRRGKRRRIMLEVGSYLGQLALPAPPEQPTRSRQSTFKEGPPPPPVTPERNLFDVASGQWLPEQTSLQRHFLQMMDSPVSQVPSRTPSPNASTQTTNTGPTTFDMEDIFDGIISPIPPSWMQQDSPPISGGSEAPGSQSEEHRRQQADVDVTMASSTSFNSLVIDLTLNDCELKDSSSCPQSHSTPAANFNDGDGDDEEVQLIYGSASFSDSWHPQQFMLPLAPNPTLDIV